jgi:hypothetical protein
MAFNGQTLPTTLRAVVLAFRDRLITAVDYLDAHNCFVTDQPMPRALPAVAPLRMATICIGPAPFDQPAFTGAGYHDLAMRFRVIVTLYQVNRSDQIGHIENAFLSEEDGLLSVFVYDVIKALQVDESGATPVQWMPHDATTGYGLLRDHPMPIIMSQPQETEMHEGDVGYVSTMIDFDAFLSWDLLS